MDRFDRQILSGYVAGGAIFVIAWGSALFVALHFIIKYW